MITGAEFCGPAHARGFRFWSGVPCSFLTPFIDHVIASPELSYVGAASEGEAVALAAGAHLAGLRSVVMCQNSGLGNTVNPLTSLCHTFRIPVLLITTHRGAPGVSDEPQHALMGEITGQLLDVLRIPWEVFPSEPHAVEPALARAVRSMDESGLPYAFVMAKGTVQKTTAAARVSQIPTAPAAAKGRFGVLPDERMARMEAVALVRDVVGGAHPVIATTGKIGRELFSLGHADNQLYMVGSMGCAPAMALGLHEGRRLTGAPSRTWVIDGDGALLMKMGALATVGATRPAGLVHVLLDNEVHDSTGGQATSSPNVDFASVALGCGYAEAHRVDEPAALAALLAELRERAGPSFVHVKVAPGANPKLGRPTLAPFEIKERLMAWLHRG